MRLSKKILAGLLLLTAGSMLAAGDEEYGSGILGFTFLSSLLGLCGRAFSTTDPALPSNQTMASYATSIPDPGLYAIQTGITLEDVPISPLSFSTLPDNGHEALQSVRADFLEMYKRSGEYSCAFSPVLFKGVDIVLDFKNHPESDAIHGTYTFPDDRITLFGPFLKNYLKDNNLYRRMNTLLHEMIHSADRNHFFIGMDTASSIQVFASFSSELEKISLRFKESSAYFYTDARYLPPGSIDPILEKNCNFSSLQLTTGNTVIQDGDFIKLMQHGLFSDDFCSGFGVILQNLADLNNFALSHRHYPDEQLAAELFARTHLPPDLLRAAFPKTLRLIDQLSREQGSQHACRFGLFSSPDGKPSAGDKQRFIQWLLLFGAVTAAVVYGAGKKLKDCRSMPVKKTDPLLDPEAGEEEMKPLIHRRSLVSP